MLRQACPPCRSRSSAATSRVSRRTLRASSCESDPVPQLGVMIACCKSVSVFHPSPAKSDACSSQRFTSDVVLSRSTIAASADKKGGKLLTTDGVHMNPAGNQMMASGVLRALGLDDAQLKKAQESWTK